MITGTIGVLRNIAIYSRSGREVWRTTRGHQQRALFLRGALTTAGGLVLSGDLDHYFKAFDVDTGKLLWQSRLGAPLHGFPKSYSVDGKQFIAVPTGIWVLHAMTAVASLEIYQPTGGKALYACELP